MGAVLLTGATGFVGTELLQRFLSAVNAMSTRSCAPPTIVPQLSGWLRTRV